MTKLDPQHVFKEKFPSFVPESFLRKTQTMQKENFHIFTFLGSFCTIIELHKKVLRIQQCQQGLILESSRLFWRYNCIFWLELVSKHPKVHSTTKTHVFWQIILNFCSNHEHFCGIELPLTRALKQKDIQNAIWGKRRLKLVEFTKKVSKVPIFLNFRQHSPNFRPFPKSYFNQKTHGLRVETFSYR